MKERENRSKQIFSNPFYFLQNQKLFFSKISPKQKKEMMFVFRVQGVWVGAF